VQGVGIDDGGCRAESDAEDDGMERKNVSCGNRDRGSDHPSH
jgi:hypothetical protein